MSAKTELNIEMMFMAQWSSTANFRSDYTQTLGFHRC